jgi:hypothetical protein
VARGARHIWVLKSFVSQPAHYLKNQNFETFPSICSGIGLGCPTPIPKEITSYPFLRARENESSYFLTAS